ncbi:hypothetical protein [Candidatus Poriferisodalis sp.]|uniref:hypothetical protein n=1 Tax=Candidatus Poriferisodalis sp. TaxID=3101277 RepID=UPI003B027E82
MTKRSTSEGNAAGGAEGNAAGDAAGDAYARRLAAVVAGHQGEAAVAEGLLDDDDASVRAAALGALARCGALQADQVRRALGDEAAEVRCRAAELVPHDVELVELVELLSDPDASVVEVAAAALGERDWDAGPVGELCRVARSHDDPLCRESAVAALGAIAAGLDAEADAPHEAAADPAARPGPGHATAAGTPHEAAADPATEPDSGHTTAAGTPHEAARGMALEVLLAAMDDRPQIRRRALLGLFQFDDDRAAAAVRAALEDRDRQVRAVAGELLGVPVR